MYEISEEILTALVNYLATKPYSEVYQVMPALQGLKKVEDKVEAEIVQ